MGPHVGHVIEGVPRPKSSDIRVWLSSLKVGAVAFAYCKRTISFCLRLVRNIIRASPCFSSFLVQLISVEVECRPCLDTLTRNAESPRLPPCNQSAPARRHSNVLESCPGQTQPSIVILPTIAARAPHLLADAHVVGHMSVPFQRVVLGADKWAHVLMKSTVVAEWPTLEAWIGGDEIGKLQLSQGLWHDSGISAPAVAV